MQFYTLVILAEDFKPSSLRKLTIELERLINPYQEGNVPEGLMDICDCVQTKAYHKAKKRITELCDNSRIAFLNEFDLTDYEIQVNNDMKSIYMEDQLEILQKGFGAIMSGMNVLAAGLAQKYIPSEKPNADCGMCNGKGKRPAFFNPKEKFDSFILASEGVRALYRVYSRDKDGVFSEESARKWLERNMSKISGFKDDYGWKAIITPDGEWHDQDDYEENNNFKDHVKKLFDQHMDCYALACNMHR